MKKVLCFILVFFISISNISADEKIKVEFKKCIDGDTAYFMLDNKEVKARFLAINTPEVNHPTKGTEPFGEKASKYTCDKLTNAKEIYFEYDDKSDRTDKYDRQLVWIWVDGELLETGLIKLGYAKVAYLYGNYKYVDILKEEEEIAKDKQIGIWGEEDNSVEPESMLAAIICIVLFMLALIFNKACHS